jgi:hypothetical protein
LSEKFQPPPNIICVQKGKGTDFPNVCLYIGGQDQNNLDASMRPNPQGEDQYNYRNSIGDALNVNRNIMYTAITRVKNNYEIILDDPNCAENLFLMYASRTKGHTRKMPADETIFRLNEIKRHFDPKGMNSLDTFCSIEEAYQSYKSYKDNILFKNPPIKYRQFVKDFNFWYPNHTFTPKMKNGLSKRQQKSTQNS